MRGVFFRRRKEGGDVGLQPEQAHVWSDCDGGDAGGSLGQANLGQLRKILY